jgi:hypothetical protein
MTPRSSSTVNTRKTNKRPFVAPNLETHDKLPSLTADTIPAGSVI